MAKMFYSLEEAAEKLGVSEDEIKQMAADGKLQQFRDRDKVMFKRDQVDGMAGGGAGDSAAINLTDPSIGDTDAIDLDAATRDDAGGGKPDARQATGISVFDADEVGDVDAGAQTVVTGSFGEDDEELALESVGSGSGLLDLTRESDDTSLGAELLEEIYPAGGGGESQGEPGGTGLGSIFDQAGGAESAPSSLADVESVGGAPMGGATAVLAEPTDPAGSGWTGGLLVGAMAALIICVLVLVTAINGAPAAIADAFAGNLMAYAGGLAGATIVLAIIGLFIGKAFDK